MKRLIILLAIPLLIYGAYKLVYPTYSWNQKLTLVVDTPEGVKTGSSVINIWVRHRPLILPDAGSVSHGLRGEATVVDLGGGRYLFALLQGSGAMTERVFGANQPDLWFENGSTRKRKAAPVPTDALPMLVTFEDVNDPKTVRLVDPADLTASFGTGYALRKITLEITRERVTEGVVEGVFDYLNWSKDKVYKYSCQAHKCDRSPMRIPTNRGTTIILTTSDFIARKLK